MLVLVAGCGEKDETTTPSPEPAPRAEAPAEPDSTDREDVLEASGVPDEGGDAADSGLSGPAGESVAAARDYVEALNSRDGRRVCELLAPGAIDQIELPRDRGGCAASLDASIGYEDPRGLPVWKSADVEAVVSVDAGPGDAKVIATIFTRFADRDEPSIEDDPIYLRRVGDEWLVVKPSLTMFRAVGQEPPPEAVAPPKTPLR